MTRPKLLVNHPFDEAVALTPQAADAHGHGAGAPRRYLGHTHPAYGNMVGPFGGVTAAQALQAVLQHPQRLGEPVSFTVNYASALAEGAFMAEARPLRTNRSTQHWLVLLTQTGADGLDATVLSATAVTAVRRSTWSASDALMPAVPAPQSIARATIAKRVKWIERYDMRPCAGPMPHTWDGSEADSLTQLWMRDDPPRPLDYLSLTALADVFYPRVWRRRALMTPVGTVSMTVYYHAGAAELAATGEDYLLGQARSQSFFNGFFDQSAELWNEAGQLLATTHQIVYYKE
jgi:acyl-CoA thioesterase